jgi:methylenetetrahydrofolate reductase (NADPH)
MDTKITIPELLAENTNKVTISVEILPPVRGDGVDCIFKIIDEIKIINPLWIDVTSHSSNIEWIPSNGDDVTYLKNKRRKSPGTIAICAAIKYKYNILTVPHLLCRGFSREETEDALIDLEYLGINNVLAIRGDDESHEPKPTLHGANEHSIDLLTQVQNMNRGEYLDQSARASRFCVGVGCYPEKHVEAPNLHVSDNLLYEKQKHGAGYAVSQMFYNNQKYFAFLDRVKEKVDIPIIPAMKIITSSKQLVTIPKYFYVDIPQTLVENMNAAKTKEQCHEVGVDWAYQQCVELIENGQNHLHFYIMRNTKPFLALIKKLNQAYKILE